MSKIDFGRHKGVSYTRVPVGYLRWMVNVGHSSGELASAELERRGTVELNLVLSGHAIDRTSQRYLDKWLSEKGGEGFYSWLLRVAEESLKVDPDDQNRREHRGMTFVFDETGVWPTLITVM